MGSEGMRYSLVSREVIADSIETVAGAEGFDGLVAIGGCDKNMPALRHGDRAARSPGGLRLRRHHPARALARASRWTSSRCSRRWGSTPPGGSPTPTWPTSSSTPVPGAGSCGGMYTANTMASAIEALGLSLPNSSAQAAISAEKLDDCRRAGAAVARLVADGMTPRRILTRQAFENAITVVDRAGRLDQRGAAPAGHRQRRRRQADARRLHPRRQARAGAGRPAAERQVRDGRARADRRADAADEAPARRTACCTATRSP